MNDIRDISSYILDKLPYISTMKLQKLCYYSQAVSLVKYDEPIFQNDIQAWSNGPVAPDLFYCHKGLFVVSNEDMKYDKKINQISPKFQKVVDYVLDKIGNLSGKELSNLSHEEKPWLLARNGHEAGEHSDTSISLESMKQFYSSPNNNPLFA